MEKERKPAMTQDQLKKSNKFYLFRIREIFSEPFKESGEVDNLISSLPEISKKASDCEVTIQRFIAITDLCQYQPTLVDPFLDRLVSKLIDVGGKIDVTVELQNVAFKFLYLLTKVRGFKVIVRHFPNDVKNMELVLNLLTLPRLQQSQTWETRYILLLWLSVSCMMPIDLERLDGNTGVEDTKQSVMDRVMEVAQHYLMKGDKTQDAASFLLSKFLTRRDTVKMKLPGFMEWSVKSLQISEDSSKNLSIVQQRGVMTSFALLFKHGRREDMQPYAKRVLETVLSLNSVMKENAALFKTGVKVIQRVGLTFLKPKVPKWRYQRGSRSLAENLAKANPSTDTVTRDTHDMTLTSTDDDEEDAYDIPDELETILDLLLSALKDDNFVVRMSAAKGIGRITSRLPHDLADEVVGSLLELFDLYNIDGRWHGGCLSLAELCRRGLLLPSRLSEVVPVVKQALLYEEKRGTNTYGSVLRDAACYVCWSFARAFEPQDIRPYVDDIAKGLIVTALFDREINVRKCAVAAFQENVGRQGTFPNGIDIVTTVDHFSVANRKETYLELSVYVAQFPEYAHELINHLTDIKMSHWDISIRELTAEAIGILTPKAPDYLCKTVLPRLLGQTMDTEVNIRHGSILCIARIIFALSKVAKEQNRSLEEYLGEDSVKAVQEIAVKIHDASLFKGLEGELMRKAVCCLIEKVSMSGLPFHEDPILDLWESILNDCLTHVDPGIQDCATVAISEFVRQYCSDKDGVALPDKQERIIGQFLKELKSPSQISRIGYCQAIGALPRCMLVGHVTELLYGLILSTKFTKREEKWVNARCSALRAITSICKTVGTGDEEKCHLSASDIEEVYSCFLIALQDYTIDGRGEVGSMVRETSLTGIKELTSVVVNKDPSLLQPNLVEEIFKKCVHQACEKKDKTRDCAGSVFIQLLNHEPVIPHIPHYEDLRRIFTGKNISDIRWGAPGETFPKFAELLKFPPYTYSVLLGFAVCVGGMTEFTVKQSSPSLHAYFTRISHNREEVSRMAQVLIDIFKDYQKVDRVSIPLLKMLDQLLIRGYFGILEENEDHAFALELLTLVKTEISKSADQVKLTASADVFCGLLLFKGEVRKKCLSSLAIFLCHRYSHLRKYTSQRLHEVIDLYDIVSGESLDELLLLLGETIWENNDLAEIKQTRNAICELLEIPIPVAVKKAK